MKAADRLRVRNAEKWYRQLGFACRKAALCATDPMHELGRILYPTYAPFLDRQGLVTWEFWRRVGPQA